MKDKEREWEREREGMGIRGSEVLMSRNAEEEEKEGARPGVCELVGWGLIQLTINLILQPKL